MPSITDLKNRYEGERIFLVGNGPSLNETPLELMQVNGEYTFGCNGITDIFDRTDWRPTFYSCVDKVLDEKYYEKAITSGIQCFVADYLLNGTDYPDNVVSINHTDLRDSENVDINTFSVDFDTIESYHDVWSEDISDTVYCYNTVLYNMMQISRYMGFDQIYLVGTDMYDVFDKYFIFPEASDPAMIESDSSSTLRNLREFLAESNYPVRSLVNAIAYKMVVSESTQKAYTALKKIDRSKGQINYAFKDYGKDWIYTREVNVRLELAHKLVDSIMDDIGLEIQNATVGGHLEVYPRADVYELLS